jgi:hypothetical protein
MNSAKVFEKEVVRQILLLKGEEVSEGWRKVCRMR